MSFSTYWVTQIGDTSAFKIVGYLFTIYLSNTVMSFDNLS